MAEDSIELGILKGAPLRNSWGGPQRSAPLLIGERPGERNTRMFSRGQGHMEVACGGAATSRGMLAATRSYERKHRSPPGASALPVTVGCFLLLSSQSQSCIPQPGGLPARLDAPSCTWQGTVLLWDGRRASSPQSDPPAPPPTILFLFPPAVDHREKACFLTRS